MSMVLILRPEPGALETAKRAEAKGLMAICAPIFSVRPVSWEAPDPRDFDAVMLTSANGARHAGEAVKAFFALPCYAVGEATAAEAARVGFTDVRSGTSDGAALLAQMIEEGARSILHLTGREHLPLAADGVEIIRRITYAADAADQLDPKALEALDEGALVLLHSPRAAGHFAVLADAAGRARADIRLAAISAAAAAAAGEGWAVKTSADVPNDEALLELAAKLCKTGARDGGNEQ